MLTVGRELPVRAAVGVPNDPSRVMAARLEERIQVVVMATGTLPTAVPPAIRLKFTLEGETETLSDSESVAFRATVAVLELTWPRVARQARHPANPSIKQILLVAAAFRIFHPAVIFEAPTAGHRSIRRTVLAVQQCFLSAQVTRRIRVYRTDTAVQENEFRP
jgi:hypothetical protein